MGVTGRCGDEDWVADELLTYSSSSIELGALDKWGDSVACLTWDIAHRLGFSAAIFKVARQERISHLPCRFHASPMCSFHCSFHRLKGHLSGTLPRAAQAGTGGLRRTHGHSPRVQEHPMQVDTCHMHGLKSKFGKDGWALIVLFAAEVGQMTTLGPFRSSPCSRLAVPDTDRPGPFAFIAPSADSSVCCYEVPPGASPSSSGPITGPTRVRQSSPPEIEFEPHLPAYRTVLLGAGCADDSRVAPS